MINKILHGLEKFKQVDNKLTTVETTFSRTEYKKIAKKGIRKLIARARGLFHFVNEFRKLHVRDLISIHCLDDQIQKTEIDTFGIFQLCFYENLFAQSIES